MSQNYNINMKKFNGTDYDGLLRLAYNGLNSQQLDGKTFNEIQILFDNKYTSFCTMSYMGTNTATATNPVTLTFPFDVQILFFQNYHTVSGNHLLNSYRTVIVDSLSLNVYTYIGESNNSSYGLTLKLKDSKTIDFYGMDWQGFSYVVGAIGGTPTSHRTEWLITDSSTKSWTVPYSRKYYIELYGCGGSAKGGNYDYLYYQGGSSCQSYNLNLQKGNSYSISLGTTTYYGDSVVQGTTKFGEYSVAGGGTANSTTPRKGAGNLGTDGTYQINETINYSKGTLKELYGWGINGYTQRSAHAARNSAIYIKYIGA